MIESLDMNILLGGGAKKPQKKQNPGANPKTDFSLYEEPRAQVKTAPLEERYVAPRDRARQKTSDSIASKAGVTKDVFEEIEKDYVANREKEKANEKQWEGFGDAFSNFLIDENSYSTSVQADKFNRGRDNRTAEEARQDIHENSALKSGVEQSLLDKINAEAAPKKGKDMFSEAVEHSIWNADASIMGVLDFFLGNALKGFGWEDNFISELNKYYQTKEEEKRNDVMAAAERTGKGKLAENTAIATMLFLELFPDAALALLTSGASAGASLTGKGGKAVRTVDLVDDVLWKKYLEKNRNDNIIKIDMQFFSERDISKQSTNSLKRGIRSFTKLIDEHKDKIKNPQKYDVDWNNKNEFAKNGLIKHWQKEIDNFNESIRERLEELIKRGEKLDD